jgi:hypothetical protein
VTAASGPAGLTAGSLCTGYGGLDIATAAVLGARLAWVAEADPHAAAVLARNWPDVPNQSPQVQLFRRGLRMELKGGYTSLPRMDPSVGLVRGWCPVMGIPAGWSASGHGPRRAAWQSLSGMAHDGRPPNCQLCTSMLA